MNFIEYRAVENVVTRRKYVESFPMRKMLKWFTSS